MPAMVEQQRLRRRNHRASTPSSTSLGSPKRKTSRAFSSVTNESEWTDTNWELDDCMRRLENVKSAVLSELDRIGADIAAIKHQSGPATDKTQIDDVPKQLEVENKSLDRTPTFSDEKIEKITGSQASHLHPEDILLREKRFVLRESMLTDLLLTPHFQTLHNIFVALLFILSGSVMSQNLMETGKLVDFSVLTHAFSKPRVVVSIWSIMFTYAVLCYFWRYAHNWLTIRGKITLYIFFQLLFVVGSTYLALKNKLPVASGFTVMAEQARFFMKTHSYFRENLFQNRVDPGTPNSSKGDERPAGFGHYIYFLFCPTLLYRSSYPRTKSVRFNYVLRYCFEVVSVVYFMYLIWVSVHPIKYYKTDSQQSKKGWEFFLAMWFSAMGPATLVLLFGFYGLLHCWLNLWSELLRFGDRQFYRDWWNASSYSSYYREWNGVVYDWLRNYIYLDTLRYFGAKYPKVGPVAKRKIAGLLVIHISAIIHEYIIACAISYFCPVLLLLFAGPGFIFTFFGQGRSDLSRQAMNIHMWATLMIGNGLLLVLYAKEYYSRQDYVMQNGLTELDLNDFEGTRELNWQFWKHFFTIYSLS